MKAPKRAQLIDLMGDMFHNAVELGAARQRHMDAAGDEASLKAEAEAIAHAFVSALDESPTVN